MKNKILPLLLAMTLGFSGCQATENHSSDNESSDNSSDKDSNNNSSNGSSDNNSGNSSNESAVMPDVSDLFSDRDFEIGYDEGHSAVIELNASSASCTSNAVKISGSTITITDEGTYILTGELDDGMIIVNTDKKKKVQLFLDNASIHSETSAAIYILQADKVFITSATDSENMLSNGGSFTAIDDNNIDSVIFSKDDLTLNGAGTLTINSPAGHGIVSKDELTITSGTYNISSSSHAVSGKDNLCIANANFTIESGKDGLRAENDDDTSLGFLYIKSGTFDITSEGDGISASAAMQIDDGTFEILSGGGHENAQKQTSDNWGGFPGNMGGGFPGGKPNGNGGGNRPGRSGNDNNSNAHNNNDTLQKTSTNTDNADSTDSTSIKGIKSSGNLLINSGTFTIDSADDSVHSNASLTVAGGTFEITTGDDGFHADKNLKISDGNIKISESYEALEGLSVDITGGTFELYASDDGINAAGGTDQSGFGGFRGNDRFSSGASSDYYINISGGDIYINACGDGIDSNGSLSISGGNTVISGPTTGDTAVLDYETEGIITGGTFVGTGGSGMNMNFSSSSSQGTMMIRLSTISGGTVITLADEDGNVFLTRETDQNYSSITLSAPEIEKGKTYILSIDGSSVEVPMEKTVCTFSTTGSSGR